MNKLILTFCAAALALPMAASGQSDSSQTLDQLLQEVERAAREQSRINEQRLQRFIRERNNQRQLLQEARAELRAQEQRSDRLRNAYDENERQLNELDITLQERLGNLGELFGVVRQVAGDLRSKIEDSIVSAQIPGRGEFLGDLAQRSELPKLEELRRLWYEMVREIAESGKVVEFTTDIVDADGQVEENRSVARLGVFNAVSNGKFLTWDDDAQTLVELPQQPAGRYQDMAAEFQSAQAGQNVDMAVDFTRGVILAQVVRSPDLRERLRQGGPVGYVIVALGILGLLFALWKAISLFLRGNGIKRQLKRDEPDEGNALGRVLKVYHENPDADIETLELKLDEAILRETAPLETGLALLKVLYVVAPLIGLLGTVVGMIETFQQITLYGTGDPSMMAGGISMALITTVLGLVVAIPLTIIHSLLQSRSRSLIQILEEQAAGMVARAAEQSHGRAH